MADMETQTQTPSAGRRAAIGALAIVGFIALIIIGIGLAIYTARYLPDLSSKVGGGAVSLSSIFHRHPSSSELQVVTPTTTLPFAETSTTTSTTSLAAQNAASTTETKKPSSGPAPVKYVTISTPVNVAPYGNPDLSVNVTDVGYLTRTGDTSSFVGSNTIPFGNDGAVKFTITNVGTNVTGPWNFSVNIPTSPSQNFVAPDQASLNPGDSVQYVLGFSRGLNSGQITVTVTADPNNRVVESSKANNISSRWVIVQ